MAFWKILTIICAVSVFAESKWYKSKRDINSSICDQFLNDTNKVRCFCSKWTQNPEQISSAECYQTVGNVSKDDPSWEGFRVLQNATKLTLTNTRGEPMTQIPTNALKHTKVIQILYVKYCNIELIHPFAFANLSLVEEMTLRDNQITTLSTNAFAHHTRLRTLSLDQNNIMEINRNVFVDLPSLEQLFLTGNKITTIHDKAFVNLTSLKELEIDKNSLFSLNNDTFTGLANLQRLELSNNRLEVIGDNTFATLISLRHLNLAENKIQMLDERAFNGLGRLQYLSLAHNLLSALENEKVFNGLASLTSLNLRDNKITLIKPNVITPILSNFYGKTSQFSIDGNKFPCECNLDVFQPLINNSQNENLKTEIYNLKCYPSAEIKTKWDTHKDELTTEPVFDEMGAQGKNSDFEYYDETELNGTLFYFDMRFLLNCSWDKEYSTDMLQPSDTLPPSTTISEQTTKLTTKDTSSPVIFTPTTIKPITRTESKLIGVGDRGILDLSLSETTSSERSNNDIENSMSKSVNNGKNEIKDDKKDTVHTTSRLATVSAKPEQKFYADQDMAADEAKPDHLKAHRSIKDVVKDKPIFIGTNNARKNMGCVSIILTMVICRLLF